MICNVCMTAADFNRPKVHRQCSDPLKCTCQHKPVGTGINKIKEVKDAQGSTD